MTTTVCLGAVWCVWGGGGSYMYDMNVMVMVDTGLPVCLGAVWCVCVGGGGSYMYDMNVMAMLAQDYRCVFGGSVLGVGSGGGVICMM